MLDSMVLLVFGIFHRKMVKNQVVHRKIWFWADFFDFSWKNPSKHRELPSFLCRNEKNGSWLNFWQHCMIFKISAFAFPSLETEWKHWMIVRIQNRPMNKRIFVLQIRDLSLIHRYEKGVFLVKIATFRSKIDNFSIF